MSLPEYQIKALYEARNRAHAVCSGLLAGNGTAETRAQFDAAMAEVENLTKQINTAEKGPFEANFRAVDIRTEARRAEVFGRFIRKGDSAMTSLTGEQRSAVERRDVGEGGNQVAHIGTYSSLGYFVPTGFVNRVEQATKYFAPLMEDGIFSVIRTASGQALPFPVSDDTGTSATIVGEAGTVNEQDPTANQVT